MKKTVSEEINIVNGMRIAQIYTPKPGLKENKIKWHDESKYIKNKI